DAVADAEAEEAPPHGGEESPGHEEVAQRGRDLQGAGKDPLRPGPEPGHQLPHQEEDEEPTGAPEPHDDERPTPACARARAQEEARAFSRFGRLEVHGRPSPQRGTHRLVPAEARHHHPVYGWRSVATTSRIPSVRRM